jgi:hypothetical protein
MATVGRGAYAAAAHAFWEGLRMFDAEAACKVLAEDAELRSPWNDGVLSGREAIQARLAEVLGDAKARPSFSIDDITGDGHVTHFTISVSGRFGAAPRRYRLSLLHLQAQIHQIQFSPL